MDLQYKKYLRNYFSMVFMLILQIMCAMDPGFRKLGVCLACPLDGQEFPV
jgi:hypothetical protein